MLDLAHKVAASLNIICSRKFKQMNIRKLRTKRVEISRDRREKLIIVRKKIWLNNSGFQIGKMRTSCTINLKFEIVSVKWNFCYYLLLSLFYLLILLLKLFLFIASYFDTSQLVIQIFLFKRYFPSFQRDFVGKYVLTI